MKESLRTLLSARGLVFALSLLLVTVLGFGMGMHLTAVLLSALLFAGSYLIDPVG